MQSSCGSTSASQRVARSLSGMFCCISLPFLHLLAPYQIPAHFHNTYSGLCSPLHEQLALRHSIPPIIAVWCFKFITATRRDFCTSELASMPPGWRGTGSRSMTRTSESMPYLALRGSKLQANFSACLLMLSASSVCSLRFNSCTEAPVSRAALLLLVPVH